MGAQSFRLPARPGLFVGICCCLILLSCSPSISTQTEVIPTQKIPTPVLQGEEIRIGLVGKPTDVNVWALFDEEGASYANYALRWEYWPRLYTLSIPEFVFTPAAAVGQPSPFIPDGEFFIGIVTLRDDLTWSDGQPFTAEDAAFTINTVLAFELGFDWKAFYDPNFLERVESEGTSTLRFYFKKIPNTGVWHYGALQGAIVQKNYWDLRIREALEKLPDHSLDQEIIEAAAGKASLEKEVDELSLRIRNLQQMGGQDRQLEAALKRAQANLDAASNSLLKLEDQRRDEFIQARQILYSLDDTGEPSLGSWMAQDANGNGWMNAINPDYPFQQPHFNKASYSVFEDESSAVSALRANDLDVILQPGGLSDQVVKQLDGDTNIQIMKSSSRSTRFLFLNPYDPTLSNPALRQAIACVLANNSANQDKLQRFASTGFFTPDSYWRQSPEPDGCGSLTGPDRLKYAIGILKKAGYTWSVEPTLDAAGINLRTLEGAEIPGLTILASETDLLNGKTTDLVRESLLVLGIPAMTSLVDVRDVNYAVFSSGEYDLAIQSWNLSPYPSYLCDWFTGTQAFKVAQQDLETQCASLAQETDLEEARRIIHQIQEILYKDSQIIPLLTESRFDAYRNITFPFESVVAGLSGVFGAPSLALPAP